MYLTVGVLMLLAAVVLLASGCSYYDYGVARDTPSLKYSQTNPDYIKGNYEFLTILFKSQDKGGLVVTLQHPLHPMAEPDTFISQLDFQLDQSQAQALTIQDVSLVHLDDKGAKIQPVKEFTIPDRQTGKTRFYVNSYARSALTPTLTEVATVHFAYKGERHEINFREKVELVKRGSLLLAALGV